MEAVRQYVTTQDVCRSRLLLRYFGETESPACGQCDVCLKTGKQSVPDKKFREISRKIEILYKEGLSEKDVLKQLSSQYDEEDVVAVMRWLIDNKKLFSRK